MLIAKTNKRLQMLKHNCKRLPMLLNFNQETSMLKHNCKRLLNQTELQRKMFDVDHLIYNQWCSQYKSDTDS